MGGDIKVSVIVPVYNVKAYLQRCVDSIRNQTYDNLEIILVDDGSTDGSHTLCDQMAQIDKRIVVVHKKNGGLSDARNAGIEHATGEVFSFIDGDDYVDPQMYEVMLAAFDTHVSMVVCGRTIISSDGIHLENVVWNAEQNVVLSKEECYRAFFKEGYNGFDVSCCNKIFRRKLFEKQRFKKGLISEDIECLYRILDRVENCVCVNKCFYKYALREGSISYSSFYEGQMDVLITVRQIRGFIEKKYPQLRMNAYRFELQWLIICWKMVQKAADKTVREKWKNRIRDRIKENIEIKYRKEFLGNYLFIMSYAILFRCDRIINMGFEYWFRIKYFIKRPN